MIKKWKTLDEKDVSINEHLRIYKHRVQLPNGKIIDDYGVVDLGAGAVVVPVTSEGNIVLVSQYRHGSDEIITGFPAGRYDEEETAEVTAIRELKEETGYETKNIKYLGKLISNPGKNRGWVKVYLAKDCIKKGQPEGDVTEEIEVMEVDWDKMEKLILEGEIVEAQTIAAWMLARKFV
jgi:8-oxo-dGTP pyrophosphatase MutT (NUDIX family)